jgi:hypothetical protein
LTHPSTPALLPLQFQGRRRAAMRIRMTAGRYFAAAFVPLLVSACGALGPDQAAPSSPPANATATVTTTVTTTLTAMPSQAPSSAAASPTSSPTDQAMAEAAALARQACQAFTDAYAVGPSTLYFPRAEQFAAAAAARDIRWTSLSADIVSANRDHISNMSSEAGRRAQLALERAVAKPCRALGVEMVYNNGAPIGT